MKTLLTTIVLSVLGYASFATPQIKSIKETETIVLVHGAWADAS